MPRNDDTTPRPPRKIIWIAGGIVILLLIAIALWGVGLGTGGALNVPGATPNGANASPSPEATMAGQPQGTTP